MTNEIEPAHSALPVLSSEETKDLVKAAIEKGGVEAIERVVALYERTQERQAAREYHDALARFQSNMKPLVRTKVVNFATRSGQNTHYAYTPLEEIAGKISKPLMDEGLSYTWDSSVEQDRITVVCKGHHIGGHTETAQFTCPIESNAGMSAQQKVAAALTFGRRQSLVQLFGLTTCDQDTDCAEPDDGEMITTNQALDLEVLIKDTKSDKAKFLNFLRIDKLENLPASRFEEAVRALEQKARGK